MIAPDMCHGRKWIVVVCAFSLPLVAAAQTGASASPGTAEGLRRLDSARRPGTLPPGVHLSAEAALATMGTAMVDGGGSVETWRGRVRGGIMRSFDEWSLGMAGEEEWIAYNRNGDSLPGWPENVRIDRLSLNAGWRPDGDWSFFGSASVSAGVGAGDGKWSKGVTGGGMAFGRCQMTPRFAWLAGLIVYDRLGDSLLVMPVPGIDWQITPRLGLVTGHGLVMSYKPEIRGPWRFNASALFDSTVCSIEDSGDEAIIRDERLPLTLGVEFRSRGGVHLQMYGGVVAWRRWQLEREDGSESSWRGDPGVIIGIEGGTTF